MRSKQTAAVLKRDKVKEKKMTKTDSRKQAQKNKKTSTREYTEAIIVALLAALFLRAFVVQAFRIPTGSMKDTLLVGDFLLVNKFIYGVRTPDGVPYPTLKAGFPFLDIAYAPIQHWRLPQFKQPKNGDVVVFKYPQDETLDYIKRCIAVAGQTLEVRNGEVFVDGQPEGKRSDLGRKYDPEEGRYVRRTKIVTPNNKTYVIRHHEEGFSRNEHFGPVEVPQKGKTIPVNAQTLKTYRTAIESYEGLEDVAVRNGHLFLDGHEVTTYTFRQDYYFMMGDNRDNSADSRSWGFLPAENVVGEALIIYFSWNKWKDYWNLLESVRWSRIAHPIR
ncbi:MAG: signal peptidase I [bacterium]